MPCTRRPKKHSNAATGNRRNWGDEIMNGKVSAASLERPSQSRTAAAKKAGKIGRAWKAVRWRGVVAILTFVLLWQILSMAGVAGFNEVPTPVSVTRTFFTEFMFSASYWNSWVVSFKRVIYGFVASQILGIPLGLALGTSRRFNYFFYPIVEILRPIPPIAWVPLSILFWPTAQLSIVFITFIGAFFIIIVNVYEGVCRIRKEHYWLALSLGASRVRIFRKVILPAVIPSIAVGMNLGIAVTWNVVIAAEMIASNSGLGRLTWEGYVSQTPVIVLVGMISIGIAGYISTTIVDYIERRMMPWKRGR